MKCENIMLPGELPTAEANPSKRCCLDPKLDYTKQSRVGVDVEIQERKLTEIYFAEGLPAAHMGSWAFNAAGFDYWSSELFSIHGLDPSSRPPTVEEFLDLVHTDDRGFMKQAIGKVLADHRRFDITKRIVRPDGKIRYIRWVGAPIAHGATFHGLVGTGMDVTEQEQLTKELQRREAYLAKAQRLSHTGTFGWNASTNEHYWSAETFRIFEFAPSSKTSLQMVLERTHPEDIASVKMAIAAAARGERIDLEHRLLMSDGRIKYLHVVGEPERREAGGIEVIGTVMDVTARKLTEVELRRSKAHLADAQRLSHTGSVGMEGSTKRIFWSEESARIYGYPPGTEPTPDLILQRVHPDDVDLLTNVLERAARGGSDFDFEHRLLMPDGSIKHIYNLSHCLRDEAGNEEVVGAIMDVTERKLTEEAIRRSEAYLAEAQKLSHTGSFGWKVSSGEIFWSNETFRIFQAAPHTKPTLEFVLTRVHPKDRELVQQQIEKASRDGKAFDFEHRLQMPDGAMKDVRVTAHPSRDSAGNLEFVGAVTDVSGHRQAEAMIRERQIEIQQILDLAPEHIGVFGPDGSPLYTNRATLEYLGVGIDCWRNETARCTFVHPDDRERLLGERERRFLEEAPHEFEIRLLGHDGKFRWFLFRLNPLKDERGQITRWYSTGIDIEERKQAEDTLRRENVALREEIDKASMFEEIVGTSPALKAVLLRISQVAPSDSTVLITGETGTGKELVARAIHRRSDRASRAFISVNCASIPRDLIATELFGHEKGAFTGATQQRLGRFELANGGTLFLDEVGELPSESQIALLRVLQEHEFERVGGGRPIRSDVRVIAASNRDLQAAISAGSFRSDLFYRLNVFPIEIPCLRERRADIPLLVEYFIDRYARKAGKKITTVDKKTLRLLESYPWPGNIRELQNVIERSVIVCETPTFSVDGSWLSQKLPERKAESQLFLSDRVAAQEKEIIETALRECQGRIAGPSGAAAKLGIARSTLESKIRSHKINKNRFRA